MTPTPRQDPSLPTIPAPDSGLDHTAFAALLEAAGETWAKKFELEDYSRGHDHFLCYWRRPDDTTLAKFDGADGERLETLLMMVLHHREQIAAAVVASQASCPPGTRGRQQKLLDLLLKGVLEGAAKQAVIDALLADLGVRVEPPPQHEFTYTAKVATQGPPPELMDLIVQLRKLWGRNGSFRTAAVGLDDRLLMDFNSEPVLRFHGAGGSNETAAMFERLLDALFTWAEEAGS